MSNESFPLITSFVIRFTSESSAEGSAEINWRGAIRHVQTDQELTFTEWQEALSFMQQYLSPKVFEQT